MYEFMLRFHVEFSMEIYPLKLSEKAFLFHIEMVEIIQAFRERKWRKKNYRKNVCDET